MVAELVRAKAERHESNARLRVALRSEIEVRERLAALRQATVSSTSGRQYGSFSDRDGRYILFAIFGRCYDKIGCFQNLRML